MKNAPFNRFFSPSRASFLLVIILGTSCSFDKEEEIFAHEVCEPENITFSGFVKPLIDSKCIACHNSVNPSGNVNLESFNSLKPHIENGKFLGSINHSPGFSPMPKGGTKLSDCDISKVKSWIDEGFANN